MKEKLLEIREKGLEKIESIIKETSLSSNNLSAR